MYITENKKLNKKMVVIQPGEHFVSHATREGIATVLGSCIAVCLYDSETAIGGMNHFMLPGDFRNDQVFASKSGRYGMFAMELLINDMMKQGANRERLTAKIFGGAHVLHFRKNDGNVPDGNILFIRSYLAMEEISIISEDLGGDDPRKIFFLPDDNGKVLLKRLKQKEGNLFIGEEKRYKANIMRTQKQEIAGAVTLFTDK
ncbi:chemoreceptor glutamine deamidase CheD [bacterium]|nr:chemoreceptor glutamine deamidase CheD [bacterium]